MLPSRTPHPNCKIRSSMDESDIRAIHNIVNMPKLLLYAVALWFNQQQKRPRIHFVCCSANPLSRFATLEKQQIFFTQATNIRNSFSYWYWWKKAYLPVERMRTNNKRHWRLGAMSSVILYLIEQIEWTKYQRASNACLCEINQCYPHLALTSDSSAFNGLIVIVYLCSLW